MADTQNVLKVLIAISQTLNCVPQVVIGRHVQLPTYAKRTRNQLISGIKKRRNERTNAAFVEIAAGACRNGGLQPAVSL